MNGSGGSEGHDGPLAQIFCISMQFSGKIGQILGLCPLWEILDLLLIGMGVRNII